jgi:vancomycin resistance protein YoaR
VIRAGTEIKRRLYGNNGSKKNTSGRNAPEPRAKRATGAAGKKAAAVLIVVIVVIAALAAAITAAGFYVNGLDTAPPNVSLGGVKLGGLTQTEAERALIDSGYEENAADVSATLYFPDGESLTVTGEEAGMKLSAYEAARMAVGYGRGGSIFGSLMNYIKCMLSPTELSSPENTPVDTEYIRSVADSGVERFNSGLLKGGYTIGDSDIVVVKGAGSALAEGGEVFDLTMEALYESARIKAPVSVEYELTPNPGGDIDLGALLKAVFKEPVSAVYDPETGNVTESVTGVSFDADGARRSLESAGTGERIVIPLIFTQPEVTSEQLESLLFRDVLAERTTYISGTSNRLTNIRLAAAAIDGKTLNPGEEFSFNDTVGQRTVEKGYASAGAYVGGKTVQEIGGGICQVSSTIYDCVLHADLEVVSRSNHMFVVTYLPYGNDATVNWGTIDFKFKNNTEYPIRIESVTDGRDLTVKLYGTKTDDGYIKTDYVTISTTGYDTVEMEDPSVEPGATKVDTSGHGGVVVETYKYYYDAAGNLLNKTFVSKSSYRAQNRIILVPPGTLNPTEPGDAPSDSPGDTDPTGTDPQDTPSDSPPAEIPTVTPTPIETPAVTPSDDPPDWLPDDPPGETEPAAPQDDDPLPEPPPDRLPSDQE